MTNTIELTTTEFRKEQKKWLDLAAKGTSILICRGKELFLLNKVPTSYRLDDETLQPTIAPIFDGDTLTNGVNSLNESFNGVSERADATTKSFIADTPNYNGPLATLSKQINSLTGVVSSFMSMVETGDIVNVNIETELNDDAIYDNIIRINRQRFKASGKNGFMI